MVVIQASLKFFKLSIFVLLAFDNLFGYIDPGSGSMILQVLLAGFFASMFYIKTIYLKLKSFIKIFFRNK